MRLLDPHPFLTKQCLEWPYRVLKESWKGPL